MRYAPEGEEELPHLRRLRWMVMGLMLVLMLGILAIAATIVIRLGFGAEKQAEPVNAKAFAVPQGQDIVTTGQGLGTVLFVTRAADGDEILSVYDSNSGALISTSRIERCDTVPCVRDLSVQ